MSSNVVEKCLKLFPDDAKVRELLRGGVCQTLMPTTLFTLLFNIAGAICTMPLWKPSDLMRIPLQGPLQEVRVVQRVDLCYQQGCLHVFDCCQFMFTSCSPVNTLFHTTQHEPQQGSGKAGFGSKNNGLSFRSRL